MDSDSQSKPQQISQAAPPMLSVQKLVMKDEDEDD